MGAVNIDCRTDGIARVAINRPDKRNALNDEVRNSLINKLPGIFADKGVHAVVLTGEGGHFCAGGDIASMEGLSAKGARARMKDNHKIVRMIAEAEKPVVTAIEGFAVGAGAGLAMLGDTAIIAEGGTIGFPFFGVGLIPDYGILHTLPRRAGGAKARQLLLYARMVKAHEAVGLGLADELVSEGMAEDVAVERAVTLASMPPFAFGIAKQQLGLAPVNLGEALEMEALAQAGCFGADEFLEGFSAFMEKRPPVFRR
ncbi:MAG: enoyl-CoA hydratase/isomerase family protein [Pseudomonadota bacterium]|nr:enoyl-CoA hydratase/isomerase family protein [Pseudomonadota bacterium]